MSLWLIHESNADGNARLKSDKGVQSLGPETRYPDTTKYANDKTAWSVIPNTLNRELSW